MTCVFNNFKQFIKSLPGVEGGCTGKEEEIQEKKNDFKIVLMRDSNTKIENPGTICIRAVSDALQKKVDTSRKKYSVFCPEREEIF